MFGTQGNPHNRRESHVCAFFKSAMTGLSNRECIRRANSFRGGVPTQAFLLLLESSLVTLKVPPCSSTAIEVLERLPPGIVQITPAPLINQKNVPRLPAPLLRIRACKTPLTNLSRDR